jgi:hypothetical protein
MTRKMSIVLLCLGIVVAVAASTKEYVIKQSEATTRVVWHNDEAFVIIGITTRGWSGSYVRMIGQAVRDSLSPWGGGYVSLRPDMVLYHFDGQQLHRYDLKGMSTSSAFMPFKGALYRGMGSLNGPPWSWKWTGSTFRRLTDEEDHELRAVGTHKDLYEREGWSEESLTPFHGVERVFPIKLKDQALVVKLTKPNGDTLEAQESNNWLRISLSGTNLPETVLYEFDQRWHRVDKHLYRELSRPPEGPDGDMMRRSVNTR